jgi:hypothetical protein
MIRSESSLTGTFDTGTDSPVSIDSFTMASPESSKASHGKTARSGSDESKISPGTRFEQSVVIPFHQSKTRT